MFTNYTRDTDKAGSAVPLTPSFPDDKVIAVTADHCVRQQRNIKLSPDIHAPWHAIAEVCTVTVNTCHRNLGMLAACWSVQTHLTN